MRKILCALMAPPLVLPGASCSKEMLADAIALAYRTYPPEKGIRLVGVTVSNFETDHPAPAELPLGPVECAC